MMAVGETVSQLKSACFGWTSNLVDLTSIFLGKRSVVVVMMICEMPCGNCLGCRVELHDEELMGR